MTTNNAAEKLGPAEQIIQMLLQYTDHMVHNRNGYVVADGSKVGVKWAPCTYRKEGDDKVVFELQKVGKKTREVRVGIMDDKGVIAERGVNKGRFQPAGLFPEVAAWMYRQVAEVWKLDNEFAARWASYAFGKEHKDLKVVLAAFMLVQSRRGDQVKDNGKVAFLDEDYRSVGEAMCLLTRKDGNDFNPKLLVRVRELLELPEVAKINRELGFGVSPVRPFLGRWPKAVEQWLRYREENIKMLQGLVKAGLRGTVMKLAEFVRYVPTSPRFYKVLRWKQGQAADGRRKLAIGEAVDAAETWEGLTEKQICERIVKDRPNFKRVVGLLPEKVGITRAIVAAAIEAGSMSDKDLIIYTPTLEELGLLEVQDVKDRWQKALKAAEDTRAANIASRVKSKAVEEKLQEAADTAVKKAVEEVMKGMRVYVIVDISGSMEGSIEGAKVLMSKFLQGFPADKLHVSVFNTAGRELEIKHASAAGVENAFKGVRASGGTDYGAGVLALQHRKPSADEAVIFLFVGDDQAQTFENAVRRSGLNPLAFGLVKIGNTFHASVRLTATALGVPCFMIDTKTFEDVYTIPRTIRALIAATPVSTVRQVAQPTIQRVSLVEEILKTQLLTKPAWAA